MKHSSESWTVSCWPCQSRYPCIVYNRRIDFCWSNCALLDFFCNALVCSLVRILHTFDILFFSVRQSSTAKTRVVFLIWHFFFSYLNCCFSFKMYMPIYRCNVEKCKWWRYLSIFEWTTFIHLYCLISNNSIFLYITGDIIPQLKKSLVSLAWLTTDDTFQLSQISADDIDNYVARKWRISQLYRRKKEIDYYCNAMMLAKMTRKPVGHHLLCLYSSSNKKHKDVVLLNRK